MLDFIDKYAPIIAILWPIVGVLGSVLEALGARLGNSAIEKLGQRIEAASIDLPKLWRASRFSGATASKRKPPSDPPTAAAVGLVAIALLLPNCSTLTAARPILAEVATVASEAAVILDALDAAADSVFSQRPNAELEARVRSGIQTCRLALIAAQQAAKGAEALDDRQAFEAFARFREAWAALEPVLREAGLDGLSRSGQEVPRPMAAGEF